jgi:DNA-binding CsgD family transcriptional regulator/tetratricopeptide (TPR) repeat protein
MPGAPLRLLGRDAERATLLDHLALDRSVVVVGEAGVGKTTLVRAATALTGREVHQGGALAMLRWRPFLALERALGEALPARAPAVASRAVQRVGAGVLVLDDLHWAHPVTLDLLATLAERLVVVGTVRTGDPGTDEALVAAERAGMARLNLRPLGLDDAATMVAGLRPDLAPGLRRAMAERSGGNPLFVEQLARTGAHAPLLESVIRIRLDALSRAAGEALALLALADRPIAVEIVVAAVADELLGAGLVDRAGQRLQLRHDLIGSAAVARLDVATVRALEGRLARLSDDPATAARHHLRAGEPALAYALATEATGRVLSPIERASNLLLAAETAAAAIPPQQVADVANGHRLDAVIALLDAGELHEAERQLEAMRQLEGPAAGRRALLLATTFRSQNRAEEAVVVVQAGLAVAGLDPATEVALRAELARSSGDPNLAIEALERARAIGIRSPEAETTVALAHLRTGQSDWEPALRTALAESMAPDSRRLELDLRQALIFAVLRDGRPAEALAEADQLEARGTALGLEGWVREAWAWRVGLLWHAGRFADAWAQAEAIREADPDAAEEFYHAQAAVDLGRFDEARVRSDRLLAVGIPGELLDGEALWAAADAALAGGRPREAHAHATLHAERYAGAQHRPFVAVIEAWAALELGRPMPGERGRGRLRLLEAAPIEIDAIAALAAGAPAPAAEGFDAAARAWTGRHARGALRTRWAAAEARRRAGVTDVATSALLELETELIENQALGLLPLVRRSLRQAGVRRSARRIRTDARLTDREREILRLVATGLQDGEISRRLGISRWAVTRSVESASTKLGAATRIEAVARLPA